jgi:phage repressor protein C with HTH and peptisase S24 domain
MSLGQRIQKARKDRGMTQENLGQAFGITREAVQQWEADETQPRGRRMRELATLLRVDLQWLLTGELPAEPKPAETPTEGGLDRSSGHMMIIYELDVRAGMASGGALQEGESVGFEAVKAQWHIPAEVIRPHTSAPENRIKIITAVGDSNVPEFFPGDRVMVDTSDTVPSPPGFFAIWDGFGEVIKRLEMVPYSKPARVRLLSANPAYEPRELDLDAVVINGRVIGKWKWT